jgi:TatD DNase family protein
MNTEFDTLCAYLPYVDTEEATTGVPILVDFDANLFHKDVDFVTATQRAQAKGVQHFVVPGSTLCDSEQAIAAAEQFQCIVAATAGIHPYNAESINLNDESVTTLRRLLSSPYCRAVGECGLDFSDGFPPSSYQVEWFR